MSDDKKQIIAHGRALGTETDFDMAQANRLHAPKLMRPRKKQGSCANLNSPRSQTRTPQSGAQRRHTEQKFCMRGVFRRFGNWLARSRRRG